MNRLAGQNFLTVEVDLSRASFPIAYKYGVYDVNERAVVRYEDGPNRTVEAHAARSGAAAAQRGRIILNDGFVRLPADTWKGAGVAIPVFSLRSETSFGVGEFTDLKLLAEWCKRTGLKLIQLLPINDTTATHTWIDSYPYSAISAFALHPLYLNIGRVADDRNKPLLAGLEEERRRLNALEAVDYEAVLNAKLAFIKRIFPSQKDQTFRREDFKQFFDQNKHWLIPYAVFCHLRDKHGTADFSQWPDHRTCKAESIAALSDASLTPDGPALHCFIQFHLHLQLREATEYAHSKGVILKGDIPIGVYPHGADAWQEPELFHLDMQAGAPPDAFAAKGQNWGLPTYNWPRMQQTGFAWWKQRFEQMSYYFDAFRIDHILGFFRIWSIPMHAVEGIMGRFVPAIPLRLEELTRRGIHCDLSRLTQPHITDRVLLDLFGPDIQIVKERFLQSRSPGHYSLRPEFSTQRQVERYLASLENSAAPAFSPSGDQEAEPSRLLSRLRHGLYDLISNVILFEAGDLNRQGFHFRFAMENTASFRDLDSWTQSQLKELYIDYFFRRQDALWTAEAMRKLPALKRVTNMLVCGEDLGLVPACVPEVMRQLGLLGLEIQRMPKAQNQVFSRPADAPYLSVVSPSTHDMSPIRGWWKEDKHLIRRFYNEELGRPGAAPEGCPPSINKAIILQHLASPAMWSIFQLQDLLGMNEHLRRADPDAERINVPSNPRNYWRYRMHLSLETLIESAAFNDELASCLGQNGR
jgi:4-alpha-glucanotransferase